MLNINSIKSYVQRVNIEKTTTSYFTKSLIPYFFIQLRDPIWMLLHLLSWLNMIFTTHLFHEDSHQPGKQSFGLFRPPLHPCSFITAIYLYEHRCHSCLCGVLRLLLRPHRMSWQFCRAQQSARQVMWSGDRTEELLVVPGEVGE